MSCEYVIYADESERRGRHYSNFFGGVLLRSGDLERVNGILGAAKDTQNLHREIKWTRVTANYLEKYKAIIRAFFDLVQDGTLKVRIMFTANRLVAMNLTPQQMENEYFMLYYQFLKHAFGLQYAPANSYPIGLRLYLDDLPDTAEKAAVFKGHIEALQRTSLLRGRIRIRRDQIAEIGSHHHVVLQCLDVVLGAMHFRLNKKHLVKPPHSRTRGKRTIAKDLLFKYINRIIRNIYPNFNVSISTGCQENEDVWKHPYRH